MTKIRKFGRRFHKKGNNKQKSGKMSAVKLGNIRMTKMVRRGMIKSKSKFVSSFTKSQNKNNHKLNAHNTNDDDDDIRRDVEADDVMDMIAPKDLKRINKTKNLKRPFWAIDGHDDGDEKQIEDYERIPRKNKFESELKKLKNGDSLIVNDNNNRENDKTEDQYDGDDGNCENDENANTEEPKSLIELLAERNVKLEELKSRIAHLATAVIARPEMNVKRLRELLSMFDIKGDDNEFGLIFISIQKIVALSGLEVFRDIIPNYRVKEKINEEDDAINSRKKNFRLKKDTQRLRDYERSLLELYRLYLMRLERMTQCLGKGKSKRSNFYDSMIHSKRAKQRIATIGVKCFTELLVSHPHFNFRNQIIETIVPLMANSNREISEMCCDAIRKVFKNDKLGDVSLETVKSIAKMVKSRSFRVNPNVLRVFLSLRIKEVKKNDDKSKKDMKKIRNKLEMMSRKEKKRNKRMQKLDNQLLEAAAEESQERVMKFHTEILNQIFVTYFRILKYNIDNDGDDRKEWFNEILTPVLEGLSKFAHLINIEFFDDLISVLYHFIKNGRLNDHQCIHSLQTIFTILSGDGSSLNIDHQRFYSQFYVLLLNIDINTNTDDIRVLLSCIETMILKRKRQITHQRVLAFIKRLSTITLQTTHESMIAILNAIRQIMSNHKQSDILIDTENFGTGSGVFNPEIEDPEFCNANSTLLWEITILRNHYHPTVRKFAMHILNGCKGSELSIDILKKNPLDLYEDYALIDNLEFNACMDIVSKKKRTQLTNSLIDCNSSIAFNGYELLHKLENS